MERDQATKFMFDLLRLMVSKGGSDLFITSGFPPAIKIDGRMTPVSSQALAAGHTADLARAIMNDKQAAGFELTREAKIAQMYSSIQTGSNVGMQTLDQNLTDLVRRNVISSAAARSAAKIPENFPG